MGSVCGTSEKDKEASGRGLINNPKAARVRAGT